jgi:hypothetical protein
MGGDLYAGGLFVNAAGIPEADRVARWDGREWFALGSNGNGNGALNGAVTAIAPSDSGLYVGGYFTNASGIAQADYVASWDGSNWSALGSNGSGDGAINSAVESLVVDGADLYVGGEFSNASGVAVADHVARWSGTGWSGCGSNALGDGALHGPAYALGVSGTGLYAGGAFLNAAGIPEADYVARCALGTHVPDGRIRLGKGQFVGDNIYNTTGANQTRTGSASPGNKVSFGISIQNDGSTADSYTVLVTGIASRAYTVRYFHGTVDITSAVVAGTYQTPSIAPTSTYLIKAQVTVTSDAAVGTKFKRLVTITSFGDTGQKDAVAFIAKRS